jgi:hypothetical protein
MARYFPLLGRRVEVHYRAGDMFLPATGRLVADSGKSIFLEEHFSQHGQVKNFRWEIPYQSIIRLTESSPTPEPAAPSSPSAKAASASAVPVGVLRSKNWPEEG